MRKSSIQTWWFAAVGVLSLIGCAHGPNMARLNQVKTAAIVGYGGEVDIREDRPEMQGSSLGGMASAVQGLSDVSSPETAARRAEEGKSSYDVLAEKLKSLGWTVLPRDQVTQNDEVKKLFADKMKNVTVNKGSRFGVDGLPWFEMADLSKDQQLALKKSLGVDVLIVAKVQVKQGRAYGYGVGQNGVFDIYPKAILSLNAYDGGEGGAIWSERWVEGANTQGKLKRTMGVNETTDEAKLVVEATQLAGDALIAKYNKAKGAGGAPAAAP